MLHFLPVCGMIRKEGEIMKFKYNMTTLEHITNDLSKLTGIAISVLDSERNFLTTASSANDYCIVFQSIGTNSRLCRCSDNTILDRCAESLKLETHICHAGLCDAAMPIMKNNMILGYIVLGRIRSANSPTESKYRPCTSEGNLLASLYHKLPCFSDEQLYCLHDLLSHILFEKAIEIETDSFIEAATSYIETHLNAPLSVDILCRVLNVSRNYLYRAFHNYYEKTVNAYITEQRINKAKLLLTETNLPVYGVAEKVGFENHTYFCKLFKKRTGFSPSEYRSTDQPR